MQQSTSSRVHLSKLTPPTVFKYILKQNTHTKARNCSWTVLRTLSTLLCESMIERCCPCMLTTRWCLMTWLKSKQYFSLCISTAPCCTGRKAAVGFSRWCVVLECFWDIAHGAGTCVVMLFGYNRMSTFYLICVCIKFSLTFETKALEFLWKRSVIPSFHNL